MLFLFLFFKQKTAYEMRISDWSSDVCSSDLSTAPVWPAGNSTRQRDDNPLMDCELIREGLSAFLDDEDAGISKTELDAHVSGCVGCSAWWARASEPQRSVRVRPAEQVPDPSAEIGRGSCRESVCTYV